MSLQPDSSAPAPGRKHTLPRRCAPVSCCAIRSATCAPTTTPCATLGTLTQQLQHRHRRSLPGALIRKTGSRPREMQPAGLLSPHRNRQVKAALAQHFRHPDPPKLRLLLMGFRDWCLRRPRPQWRGSSHRHAHPRRRIRPRPPDRRRCVAQASAPATACSGTWTCCLNGGSPLSLINADLSPAVSSILICATATGPAPSPPGWKPG